MRTVHTTPEYNQDPGGSDQDSILGVDVTGERIYRLTESISFTNQTIQSPGVGRGRRLLLAEQAYNLVQERSPCRRGGRLHNERLTVGRVRERLRGGVGSPRQRRRMVVHDLPLALDLAPHVREARLHRRAVVGRAGHEGVHARVEIGVLAVALHVVGGDGTLRELLEEVDEVLPGRMGVADEVGRDRGQKGKLRRGVERGDLVVVLGNERVVPLLEVLLLREGRSATANCGRQQCTEEREDLKLHQG